MILKVSAITPDLPPETLGKVNRYLYEKFAGAPKEEDGSLYQHIYWDGETRMWISKIPFYTTSIDAALGLCERLKLDYCIEGYSSLADGSAHVFKADPTSTKRWKDQLLNASHVYSHSLLHLPCAIIRVLLRSQGVEEVEI